MASDDQKRDDEAKKGALSKLFMLFMPSPEHQPEPECDPDKVDRAGNVIPCSEQKKKKAK